MSNESDYELVQVNWHAVGSRIRELRGKSVSQAELAKSVGVSQSHISAVERGDNELGVVPMLRIARRFATTVEWLALGDPRSPFDSLLSAAEDLFAKDNLAAAYVIALQVFETYFAPLASNVVKNEPRRLARVDHRSERSRLKHPAGAHASDLMAQLIEVRNSLVHRGATSISANELKSFLDTTKELISLLREADKNKEMGQAETAKEVARHL